MRILAWNLGHQTRERRLKPAFLPTIEALSPDVIVLNEYVDGASRAQMKDALRLTGLDAIECSERIDRHNQVLIAARSALSSGTVSAAALDDTARSNFLSVVVAAAQIEIVGFRAPAYTAIRDRRTFWSGMDQIIRNAAGRVLFIGDMNADPSDPSTPGGAVLAALRVDGWQVPEAAGEWSFARKNARTRIDHAVVSPAIALTGAAYVSTLGDLHCAGPIKGVYDHAPLVLDIDERLMNERCN